MKQTFQMNACITPDAITTFYNQSTESTSEGVPYMLVKCTVTDILQEK